MTFQSNSSWRDSLRDNSLTHPGFTVIKPYAIMELGSAKRRKGFTHFLEATGLINWQGMRWAPFYATEQSDIGLYGWRLNYFGTKRGPVSVFEYKVSLENVSQNEYVRYSIFPVSDGITSTNRGQVEAKYTWNYIAEKKKGRSIELRGYFGRVGMLSATRSSDRAAQTENMYLMLSGASGLQDVFYDEYFRGRNAAPTFGNNSWGGDYNFTTNGQQRMDNMGGMGTATFLGSAKGLTAVNFSMSLPKVPGYIRLFYDYAIMNSAVNLNYQDAGIMIRGGFFKLSLPLWMSQGLAETLGTIDMTTPSPTLILPTYKQQLQRGIRFSLNIPLNSGLFLRKGIFSAL
jgi:hypothetical protein